MDSDYVVIGFDTRVPEGGLQLFKCFHLYNQSIEDKVDELSAEQAKRRPQIIYTVVKKSDLWW